MPNTSPIYWVYMDLYKLYEENKDCWVTRTFKIFQEFSKLSGLDFEQFKSKSKSVIKKKLKLFLRDDYDMYEEKWIRELDLCTAENNKKLRTYKVSN